ncbi:MAG: hypothetical protein GXO69_08385 [Acidobacteria bacterium]|nr:hypothetical protein [Acidobacteriota bacterium]
MHSGLTRSKVIIALTGLLLLSACTPEKKYRVLSFFFDGVPNPSLSGKESNSKAGPEKSQIIAAQKAIRKARNKRREKKPETYVSQHPPYVNRQCERCHNQTSRNMLVSSKAELCFNCHEKSKFTGPYVHGPVAVGACLMCHLPHRSVNPSLLVKKTPGLCLQCHNKTDIFANENHEGVTDCLECHQPHVSGNPMFLQ